ncbi:DUF3459 domain-containing protein [Parvularcula sp. ZS-1/3]|uniref:DUF3459 domain-containing protein n=1 Tax=Parvularcula mediterranea TaxID=2732508 RepID=A0A7Y3RLD0_9PROT|nr:alpha-amylase family glycosyl hydrolase [Parvularcula mediterranea]NNU16232.1 DUF3459 domain-containing protein [Parvularcula mediterranea]
MKLIPALFLAILIASCSQRTEPADTQAPLSSKTPNTPEQQEPPQPELYYHIFVRSFADSDGDRQGDLDGIRQKLDFLQSLGVTGILLTPLYPSQFYHNYFANDFYGIDPEFGSMEDYVALVEEIHQRGMTIILDQEIQYVSGQHEWFKEASGNPGSPSDGYVLFDDEQNTRPVGTLFNLTEFDVWPSQKQNIYTVDLLSEKARAYFTEYLLFWLDPNGDGHFSDGADGYRIDHMMDDLDNAGVLTGLFDAFWVPIFDELREAKPDIKIIAEQADWGYGEAFVNQGEADMVFGFPIRGAILDLDGAGFADAVSETNAVLGSDHGQFVFVENHDTDRIASHLEDPRALRLAAASNLLTGWTPILYYGQELGMRGEKLEGDLPDALLSSQHDVRDIPIREAMRWDSQQPDALADWYLSDPSAYDLPSAHALDGPEWVDVQEADEGSLLAFYRRLTRLRANHPALANGSTAVAETSGDTVVLRREHLEGSVLVAFNFGAVEAPLAIQDADWMPVTGSVGPSAGSAVLSAYGVAIAAVPTAQGEATSD